jgi:hypothetical protein
LSTSNRVIAVAERIGIIAESLHNKLRFFVLLGAGACMLLAFTAFDIDSPWWWNSVKVGMFMIPSFIWLLVLLVLKQLKETPELVSESLGGDDGLVQDLKSVSLDSPVGLRSLYSSVRAFRQEEGFEAVFDSISGIGLIINPLFAFIAFFAMAILFLFILIAPFVLLI